MNIQAFLSVVDAYCAATGLAEATVSTRVLFDGKRIEKIRAGNDIGVRRMEEAVHWFAQNWPPAAKWPRGIARPQASPESARAS
jgi:hypothetical protein